jgi:GH18 family chitinase
VSFLSEVLNGMSLMTFDFHNEQDPITGVASPLYDQGWGEKGLSVDGCVKNYYKAGAGLVANKISIGVPFYGKTYSYASDLNAPHSNTNGLFAGNVDQANWPQDLGTPVFYNVRLIVVSSPIFTVVITHFALISCWTQWLRVAWCASVMNLPSQLMHTSKMEAVW